MIRTEQLSYRYPGAQAEAQIVFPDIDVPQGAVLLLKGPSGSGKSTWLALAAALLRPSGGQITVAGQNLRALNNFAGDAWRAKTIGFLPQKLHLSPALTVLGNLELAQWAAGTAADQRQIHQVLESLGLGELAQRKPSQLSGGQAQRVALARAVLLSPKLILADEPTASLDDVAAVQALTLLARSAQACAATLVIATHDSRVSQALPQAIHCRIERSPTQAASRVERGLPA